MNLKFSNKNLGSNFDPRILHQSNHIVFDRIDSNQLNHYCMLQKTIVSDDPLKRSLDHDPETAIDSISKSESNASKSSTKPNYLFDGVFVGDSIEKNQTQSQSQSVSVDKSNTIVERNESMVLQFDPREYDWMDSPPTLYQTSGTRSYDERQSNDNQELEKHTERPIDVGWVGNWASDFDILLKDPIGIKAFADFLRKEFSHENLRFFLAVQEFKKLTDTDQIRIQSQEIYNKFISASAPDPVNVDSKGKKSVEHSLLNPDCRTFALAEKQIYNLMKFDSYVRFLKSEIYEKCLLLDLKGKTLPYEKDYVEDQDQDVLKQQKLSHQKSASLSSMPASKELIGSRKQFMMRKLTNSITKIRSKSLDEHLTNHVCSKQLGSEPSSHSSSIDKNVLAQKSYHFCSSRSSLIPNSSDSIDSSDHTNVFQSSSDINRSVPDVGYIMTATSPPPYKTLIANSDPSSPLATSSLSTSSTSNQNRMKASSSSSFNHNCNRDNCHLLRIVFPDRSQTVIPPSPNETIDGLLTRLIEKRSLKYLAWDVFVTGSDKPLDPNTNANQLGCSELRVEQRVLFQIEFPSQDIIGVKARPNKLCCDVFKPLLLRYGYRPEHIVITVAETQQTVPSMSPVSLIDGQHILVSYRSDLEEWGWNVTRNNIPVALALSGKSFSEDNGKAQDKKLSKNCDNSVSIVEQRTSSLQSLPPNQSSSAPTVATYHNIDSSRDRIIIDDEIEKLNSSASTPGDDTQSDLFFQELIKTAHTVPSPAGDALTRTSYGVNIESQQFQEVAGQTQTYLTKPNRNSQPISASHSPTHRTLRDLQNHRHFKSYQPTNSSPSINIMEEQILSRPIVHRENLTIPSPQKPPLRRMKSDPPPPLPPKSGCIVSNPSQQRPMESKPLNENEDRRKD
ncbi:Regulator of G-protein signaling 12 [Sarcoptes scabiei]|uniref:Regulator of G-protein signaling 12 n=1 Tax=Sarcoptes scabiei TaxID=52283 RepID=A0A834RGC3_SARSC|nr:Regulator of G-protein signaling 12 [Sarcoptes scabiei]